MTIIDIFKEIFSTLPPSNVLWTLSLLVISILTRLAITPFGKGWLGERFVAFLLKIYLPKKIYRVFHNVTLPTEDGTTQIDHIVISPFGVFCIETKNMTGWIFGSERQATWTQQIYRSRTNFQNPLRQNYKHTETLRTQLDLPKESVHSVVVFVGNSTFKTIMPANVGSTKICLSYIRSKNVPLFNSFEVDRMFEAIQLGRLEPTRATHRLHVSNLNHKRTLATKHTYSDNPYCPKCRATMVNRTTQKGPNSGEEFWGCPNFPECRGNRSIT